jgi:hypothetical protein
MTPNRLDGAPTCPHCSRRLQRMHRGGLQRMLYARVYACGTCDYRSHVVRPLLNALLVGRLLVRSRVTS